MEFRHEEVKGHTYLIGKMDTFAQLHVGRRLLPMIAGLVTAFSKPSSIAHSEDQILELATGPLADIFSKMSDEDVNYIVHKCLGACQRKQATGYAKVFTNGVLMFQDIQLDAFMMLVWYAIQENLGSFFPTSQPASDTQK